MTLNGDAPSGGEDLLWTAARIGQALNITERQAHHLLEQGRLPAKKIGGRWVASRHALLSMVLSVKAA